MTSPKVVVRTGYKLSLNNVDRGKIYNKTDKAYVDGILKYFSNDEKE